MPPDRDLYAELDRLLADIASALAANERYHCVACVPLDVRHPGGPLLIWDKHSDGWGLFVGLPSEGTAIDTASLQMRMLACRQLDALLAEIKNAAAQRVVHMESAIRAAELFLTKLELS